MNPNKTHYFTFIKKVFLPLVCMGLCVGFLTGAIAGFYNYVAELLVKYSSILFGKLRNNLKWLPLAFAINIVLGLIIGFLVEKFPEIRGSGIPYIESVARGNSKLLWYVSLPLMFVTSLVCLFSALSLGSEGPSVYIGGCVGYAIGKLIHLNDIHEMLLVSAGSASGLAVAFNAPVTGLIFSLEEVYRKFSAHIVLSSIVSVSMALTFLHSVFHPPVLRIGILENEKFNLTMFGVSILTGIAGGLVGSLFNYVIRKTPVLYKKIPHMRMCFYSIIPEIFSIIIGVWWPDASFSGSEIMQKVMTDQLTTWEIAVSFVVKFLFTCVCFGAKPSGGIFIPMLSIGSLCGGLVAKACVACGMNTNKYSYVVLMCVSAFFTGVVRAPLTSALLPVEYTGKFGGWCGSLTAIAFAYIVAELLQIDPLYEALMESIIENDDDDPINTYKFAFTVSLESTICGMTIREVILPEKAVISRIVRDDLSMIPKEDYQIVEEDEIYFKVETSNPDYVEEQLSKLF